MCTCVYIYAVYNHKNNKSKTFYIVIKKNVLYYKNQFIQFDQFVVFKLLISLEKNVWEWLYIQKIVIY